MPPTEPQKAIPSFASFRTPDAGRPLDFVLPPRKSENWDELKAVFTGRVDTGTNERVGRSFEASKIRSVAFERRHSSDSSYTRDPIRRFRRFLSFGLPPIFCSTFVKTFVEWSTFIVAFFLLVLGYRVSSLQNNRARNETSEKFLF